MTKHENFNEVKGDIIQLFKEKNFDIIVQGCNCFCVQGKGLALQIAKQFPQALTIDKKTQVSDVHKLGSFSYATTEYGKIINLYTQFKPGPHFEYSALIKGLHRINKHYKGKHIAFPQIGAGIGKGDWSIIRYLLYTMLPDLQVTIVYYDNGQIEMGL
jgi:O-acetyl-ADP-ribose deacetylase (regulator of RNase III)